MSEQVTEQSMFLFTELGEDALVEGRPFDAVAFGTFTDMFGREVTLKVKDADTFVANTQAAIEATRGESGELIGLPIDALNHDKGDAAGWIVGIEFAEGLIRLIPKWTEIGQEVISKGIRRFFSATINTAEKVILGGTLTNWPATRDKGGRLMLRPIELSSQIQSLTEDQPPAGRAGDSGQNQEKETNMPDEIIETQEEPEVETPQAPASPDALPPAELAELIKQARAEGHEGPAQLAKIVQRTADKLAEKRVAQMLESNRREWEITELAAQLTGGGNHGLPVEVPELTDFLLGLNQDQFDQARSIFGKIVNNGLVEFTEYGHGRRMRKKQLPAEYREPLKAALDAGNTVAEFFRAVDLDASEFDLSEYIEGGK